MSFEDGNIKILDITFKELNRKSAEYKKVKALYISAFPVYERYPLFILNWWSKSKNAKFYNIYDGELWIGFNYLMMDNNILMLQYLAIDANIRSKGYGGKIIEKIKNMYSDKVIILGIEIPDEKSKNNEDRIKRKKFYLNNGFIESGYYIKQKPVPFELLIYGNYFSIDKLYKLYETLFGKIVWKIFYQLIKNIIIKNN